MVIPEGVTSIGEYAFAYTPLSSVELPSTLKSIGKYAFYGTGLTSVVIPEGVTSIGDVAFDYTQLSSVELPSTLESVGEGAFYNTNLVSVTLPSGIQSIASGGFRETVQLTCVKNYYYNASRCNFCGVDGCCKDETACNYNPDAVYGVTDQCEVLDECGVCGGGNACCADYDVSTCQSSDVCWWHVEAGMCSNVCDKAVSNATVRICASSMCGAGTQLVNGQCAPACTSDNCTELLTAYQRTQCQA